MAIKIPSWSEIRNTLAFHYIVRIGIGVLTIELVLPNSEIVNPLWAIISLIVVTEPQLQTAWVSFRARFINTLIGCATGLFFLFAFGIYNDLIVLAVAMAAFFSIVITRMQQGWRIGPITAALVISAGLTGNSTHSALGLALGRTASVMIGSVIALAVSWILWHFWKPQPSGKD